MRVQLIIHSYSPENTPPSRRWDAFVEQLIRQGFEIDVVTPQADPRHTPQDGSSAHQSGLGEWGESITRLPQLSWLTGSRNGRFLASIVHAAISVPASWLRPKPDVLVATVPALPYVVPAWLISKLRRVPLVLEMRDAWPDLAHESGVSAGPLGTVMEKTVVHAQRSAALIVTVTKGFADRLRERGLNDVVTVENGVRLEETFPLAPRERSQGELHVLYLGNHGESQNLETAIEAASLARRSCPTIKVRFVGSGTQREILEQLNRSLGEPVEMVGSVFGSSVREQYRWADTCVVSLRDDWPSFAWTVPSKTYEILAIGRHITALVTGETADLLATTGSANIVNADATEIAALWCRLADDPSSTTTNQRARGWMEQRGNLSRSGRSMAEHLLRLVDRTSTSRKDGERKCPSEG